MPDDLYARVVQGIPVAAFRKLGDEFLKALLLREQDVVRKSVALKCVLSMSRSRIKKLLAEYIGENNWRYYNAVFWLDLGVSVEPKTVKTVANNAAKRAWPASV
jgi:hypothetical protein